MNWIKEALEKAQTRMPQGMRRVEIAADGAAYTWGANRTVIVSGQVESDGKRWLHISVACKRRLPTYKELAIVRHTFIGEDRYSVMVFPPTDRYVNVHRFALHLFACWDEYPLPEF